MKRRDLVQAPERAGCKLLRHGGRHDTYHHPLTGRKLARKIIKDLTTGGSAEAQ